MDACAKLVVNVRLARNALRLSYAEFRELIERAGLTGSIWLPASALQAKACAPGPIYLAMQAARLNFGLFYKFNLVSYSRLRAGTFWDRPRFKFIHEIMVENRPCDRTTLFQEVAQGRPFLGTLATGADTEKLVIDDAAKLGQYYDGCMKLAESIRTVGLMDAPNEGSSITVAIDQHGQFLHLSKGNHRLAVAMVLGIERIPVRVRYICGDYFTRFVDRRRLSAPQLMAAIGDAVATAEHRVRSARAVTDVDGAYGIEPKSLVPRIADTPALESGGSLVRPGPLN
jgi:hypothetical protein